MATARLGGAVIDFRANNQELIRKVRQNKKAFEEHRRSMARTGQSAKSLQKNFSKLTAGLTALATAFGVRQLGGWIEGMTVAGATLQKLSLQTGTSVNFLQRLGRAAESDNVSLNSLHKAVQKLAFTTGEAQRGLKTYSDAFEGLGINVQDASFKALTANDRFLTVANALGTMTDKTKQASIQGALLGQRVAGLLTVFQRGEGDLAAYLDQFSRFGEFSEKQAKQLEDLNQKFYDMRESIRQAFSEVVADNIGAVTKALDGFTTAANAAATASGWLGGLVSWSVNDIGQLGNFFGRLADVVSGRTGPAFDRGAASGIGNPSARPPAFDRANALAFGVPRGGATSLLGTYDANIVPGAHAAARFKEVIKEATTAGVTEGVADVGALRREVGGVAGGAVPQFLASAAAGAAGGSNAVALGRARTAELNVAYERLEQIRSISRNIGDSLAGAFTDFISGAESAGRAVQRLGQQIVENILQKLVTGPLSDALTSGLSSLGGSLFGSFGRAASGGIRQGLTLVGEQGPELVDFHTPARVYTAGQTRSMAGGGGATLNFAPIINTVDARGVRQVLVESSPAFVQAAERLTALDLSRPSAVRQRVRGG